MKREEAARILEKQFDKSCGNYRYQNKDKLDYEDALWMAISSLRELEAQEKQKPFGEWISVKDRLPDKQADVLMLFGHNMAVGFWYDGDEDVTFWCAYADNGYYTDCDAEPTHWMPLPEPPMED